MQQMFHDDANLAQELSVGHRPHSTLNPQDAALFRSFQSNLLSLISHELRTPLTGILNSLGVLEESAMADAPTEFSATELISMARRNAQRLHRTLASLLDLAALESGIFHARLREVDFLRLAKSRVLAQQPLLKEREIRVQWQNEANESSGDEVAAVLGDPQKLGRAMDLCMETLIPRAPRGSEIQVRISSAKLDILFILPAELEKTWQTAWTQGVAGHHGGVGTPGSAFGGVLQTEEAFLTRNEEGLGSEMVLIHEIMRLHYGKLDCSLGEKVSSGEGRRVRLSLTLPELSSEEGLRAVLASRMGQVSLDLGSLGSVALGLVEVPKGMPVEDFRIQLKKNLFRASDSVYALPDRGQVAVVLDDCKPEDAPRLLARIQKSVGRTLRFGIVTCPQEGQDPAQLIELAERRMSAQVATSS